MIYVLMVIVTITSNAATVEYSSTTKLNCSQIQQQAINTNRTVLCVAKEEDI